MIRIIPVRNTTSFAAKFRPKEQATHRRTATKILSDVRKKGDTAVLYYEAKFGSKVRSLRVSAKEIASAYSKVSAKELAAIRTSKNRLAKSEKLLYSMLKDHAISSDGIKVSKTFLSLDSVGCYVPGGLAKYPSSAIMSVTPAKVAGVKRIVVATPPSSDGSISPMTLVAADICGATEIYKTGGAQAIAALSYGTKTIRPVHKIVGPGGTFVTLAKSMVSSTTAIDMLAGPTELGILADYSSNTNYVAADLISQAEHSADTFCYVITNSLAKASQIDKAVVSMSAKIPRGEIVRKSLKQNGFIAVCSSKNDMINLANQLAPEHLEVLTKNPASVAQKITTPGMVLVGEYSPSSVGDYMFGTNHILPTGGSGKSRGSLSVLDFVKLKTSVASTRAALSRVSRYAKTLAEAEGLPNHYTALEERLR